MFEREAERLRRTKWKDANELAEELYAILSNATLPLSHEGPVTLFQPASGEPALTLKGGKDGDTILRIDPKPQKPQDPKPPPKDVTLDGGTPQLPGNADSATIAAATANQPPSAFAGRVRSGGGTKYQIELTTGKKINAVALQLLETETLPAETGVLVVLSQGVYYIQPPVWL